VGVLAWRVGGGGGACAKKVAAGREIGKEKRARGEGGEESDDGGEVMQSYDRNGERTRSGAGADARSEEAWGEGRQTRGSGWKGGRDFVSSSFFLVVEKYVVLRATPILSVKNEKPCRFTLPTGSQNCPLAIRLAFSPRPLAFLARRSGSQFLCILRASNTLTLLRGAKLIPTRAHAAISSPR
jgi:hypothetical protein